MQISEILGFDFKTKSKNSVGGGSQDSKLDPYSDPETNVYSFGILLLEIISGKLVYSKEQGSIEEWVCLGSNLLSVFLEVILSDTYLN